VWAVEAEKQKKRDSSSGEVSELRALSLPMLFALVQTFKKVAVSLF
jgi:hypothetical protein